MIYSKGEFSRALDTLRITAELSHAHRRQTTCCCEISERGRDCHAILRRFPQQAAQFHLPVEFSGESRDAQNRPSDRSGATRSF